SASPRDGNSTAISAPAVTPEPQAHANSMSPPIPRVDSQATVTTRSLPPVATVAADPQAAAVKRLRDEAARRQADADSAKKVLNRLQHELVTTRDSFVLAWKNAQESHQQLDARRHLADSVVDATATKMDAAARRVGALGPGPYRAAEAEHK